MLLNRRVLILNKSWIPVQITTVKRAICLVYTGLARFVDCDTYQMYDFDEWCKRASSAFIKTPSVRVPLPSVVVLIDYNGMRAHTKVPFSRVNLLKRDNYTCQYCGKELRSNQLNIDHIMPRSRGGMTSWTNCVAACYRCNNKKDNKTPREASMRLLKQPIRPNWSFYMFGSVENEEWKRFIHESKR